MRYDEALKQACDVLGVHDIPKFIKHHSVDEIRKIEAFFQLVAEIYADQKKSQRNEH